VRSEDALSKSPRRDLIDGLRYLVRNKNARALVLASVLSGSAAWVYVALLPVMTRDVLGGDAFLFGVLSTAIGVGQIPAAVGLALYKDYRWSGPSYIAAVLLLGVSIIGFAISTSVLLSSVFLALTGFAFAAQFILLSGMLLRLVVPEYHGRVMGALNITWGVNVIGMLAAGAVVEALGVSMVTGLSGCAVVVSAILVVAIRPQLLKL
jgi:MFS family permease